MIKNKNEQQEPVGILVEDEEGSVVDWSFDKGAWKDDYRIILEKRYKKNCTISPLYSQQTIDALLRQITDLEAEVERRINSSISLDQKRKKRIEELTKQLSDISDKYLSGGVMFRTIDGVIKNLHLESDKAILLKELKEIQHYSKEFRNENAMHKFLNLIEEIATKAIKKVSK